MTWRKIEEKTLTGWPYLPDSKRTKALRERIVRDAKTLDMMELSTVVRNRKMDALRADHRKKGGWSEQRINYLTAELAVKIVNDTIVPVSKEEFIKEAVSVVTSIKFLKGKDNLKFGEQYDLRSKFNALRKAMERGELTSSDLGFSEEEFNSFWKY